MQPLTSSVRTSLTISWALFEDASTFTVSYFNINTGCFNDTNTISGISSSETMYTLTGLEEGTNYSIAVTAIMVGGEILEESINWTTGIIG